MRISRRKSGSGGLWLAMVWLCLPVAAQAWQAQDSTAGASSVAGDGPKPGEARPCSEIAIRQAAARKTAPDLGGCQIAKVTPALLLFYKIVPQVSEASGDATPGTILTQAPEAGAPLGGGDTLRVVVSGGPAKAANQEDTGKDTGSGATAGPDGGSAETDGRSGVSDSSMPPASGDVASVAETPASPSSTVDDMAGEAKTAKPFRFDMRKLPHLGYVIAAAAGALLVAVLSVLMARPRRRSSRRSRTVAAPDVTCELSFGPGRVTNLEGATGGASAVDVTVLSERVKG